MQAEKRALRALQRNRLAALAPEAKADAAAAAAAALAGSGPWRRSACLLAFWPLADEIDATGLLAAAAALGRPVYLPRLAGADLEFRLWRPGDRLSADGPFGLREPLPAAPAFDPAAAPGPLLVLVPGLAFDAAGRRLGRGKGYYDRFLHRLRGVRPDLTALGYGFAEHLVDAVPAGPGDAGLDAWCLSGKIVECPRRRAPDSLY
jgi:5-formyltetrahydrofolate cyclo-ligase